ncbi:MAG TPA: ATP-binding protein [Ignavibacteria bacterium]|nr:ATP-binding protein [Ignavibacteria bacterium]HRA99208.1 ATP-binding protein [Ignavibacteria bacterium]
MDNTNKILFKSSTKNLSLLRKFIEDKALAFGFDESSINQIILSVDEACTNIIKHAHKYNEKEIIEVDLDSNENQFIIKLNYKGKAFDPNNISNPDMNDYFNKFKVGGLGVPIMKKFMNKIEFLHLNPDSNRLTLIKNL